MAAELTKKEVAQLEETIEVFEQITHSQPQDWQSLEILKQAYDKLGRTNDVIRTSRRLGEAYKWVKLIQKAIAEYEAILKIHPDDFDAKYELAEIKKELQ